LRLAIVAAVVTFGSNAVPAPVPESTPEAAVAPPDRATLPRCDDLRLTAAQMSAAFRKHAAASGDLPEGQEAFDAIGDELGCRWPWSAQESRRGMQRMLEKAGDFRGTPK
jgi:hypothetical protein